MRIALGVHGWDIDAALRMYRYMADEVVSFATPTRFNAGTPNGQLSSCFLNKIRKDSVEGIYDTIRECARCSKYAGGVGTAISDVRSKGSYVKGSNGRANGIVPMLRNFNATARYIDQGGGKRKGAFSVYLEPWHDDVFDFLELKKGFGESPELRTLDLYTALWIPDLLMRRAKEGLAWSLFTPSTAPGLTGVWGSEFEALYERYESEGRAVRTVRATDVMVAFAESFGETGMPYPMFKDACNRKSNHQHLGTITNSNLCTEVVQYCSTKETATCNLASIALPKMVDRARARFDHQRLRETVRQLVRDLNAIIDRNRYFSKRMRRSNMRHRPMGIGVQGLADVFQIMRMPWESEEARTLNREIFETIYYAALEESNAMAAEVGAYESYPGSP